PEIRSSFFPCRNANQLRFLANFSRCRAGRNRGGYSSAGPEPGLSAHGKPDGVALQLDGSTETVARLQRPDRLRWSQGQSLAAILGSEPFSGPAPAAVR